MRTIRAKLTQLLGLFAVLTLIIAGCGGGGGGGASGCRPSGAEFTVGSKEFTEQLILGQITLQALENAGATVNDQIGLAGTVAARKALESGEIDMYWEYTGTGWITYSGYTNPIPDRQEAIRSRGQGGLKENDIEWLFRRLRPTTPTPWRAQRSLRQARRQEAFGLQAAGRGEPGRGYRVCGDRVLDPRRRPAGDGESIRFRVPEGEHRQDRRRSDLPTTDKGDSATSVRCSRPTVDPGARPRAHRGRESFFPIYNPALNVRKDVIEEYPQIAVVRAHLREAHHPGAAGSEREGRRGWATRRPGGRRVAQRERLHLRRRPTAIAATSGNRFIPVPGGSIPRLRAQERINERGSK